MNQTFHRGVWLAALLLAASIAGVGCDRQNSPVPDAKASPAPSVSATTTTFQHEVNIDPELVSSGRVQMKPAEKRSLSDEIVAAGETVPSVDGEAEVGALVSGRVSAIYAKEGDVVKRGQVLAVIDAPEAARMQGDWLRAKARLWRAQKMVEQERALWADKATSERNLHAAEAELRESLAAERSALDLISASHVPVPTEGKSNSARVPLTSPIAGVVAKRAAVMGGHVTAEMSLFEIVAPEKLLVRANVPEVVARRVESGTEAVIRPRGQDTTCTGKVQSKLDRIDETKRTMGVMISLDKGCPPMVVGAFADVTVKLSASGLRPRWWCRVRRSWSSTEPHRCLCMIHRRGPATLSFMW